jgi:hypothetical protein
LNKEKNLMNPKAALLTRKTAVIGLILTIALFGFELFNFDTTRFALSHLMSGRQFWGLEWAGILALAFGSLDFAGLVRVFTPEKELSQESSEVWLMTGAWLVGAALNAAMTWYAMALLIAPLGADIGATLFTHEQMLQAAPILIAILVWLTRVSLISSAALTLERLSEAGSKAQTTRSRGSLGLPSQPPIRERQRSLIFSDNGHDEEQFEME